MATLPTINPNGAVVNTANQWAVGSYLDIDEPVASADGNAVGDDTNANVTEYGRYLLADVPADLVSMDTVAAQVRYRVLGAQTNNRTLRVQIVTDEATPVALTNEVTVATNITNTTFTNSSVLTLTIQGTPTKAQWNNAVVALRLDITRNKGGDTNGIRVDAVNVTGTYTAQVPVEHTHTQTDTIGITDSATVELGTEFSETLTDAVGITDSAEIALWRQFADGTSATTGATVTGLTGNEDYYFKVQAVNAVGTGPDSNIAGPYTPTVASTQILGVQSNSLSASDTATVTASATLDPVESASTSVSDTAGIVSTTQVGGTESSSLSVSDTAGIVVTVLVDGVESNSLSVSDTATIVPSANIVGAESASLSASDIAGINASTVVDGAESASLSTSDTANISSETNISSTEANSLSASDIVGITASTSVDPVESASLSVSDTAGIVSTTQVGGTESSSITASDIADIANGTSYIWDGSDPVAAPPSLTYELGTRFEVATGGSLIHGFRIWNPGLSTVSYRVLRLWNGAGAQIVDGTFPFDLPDQLNAGWNYFRLPTPYSIAAGTWTLSYPTNGQNTVSDYGFVSFSAYSAGDFTLLGGYYDTGLSNYPNQSGSFYGIDIQHLPSINAVPSNPTDFVALGSNGSVSLSWGDSTSGFPVPTYTIERRIGAGAWTPLTSGITYGTRSYIDSTAINGTTYRYRIQATNIEGVSQWVESADVTPANYPLTWYEPSNTPVSPAPDSGLYSLGMYYLVESVILVTHVRIWMPRQITVTNRTLRLVSGPSYLVATSYYTQEISDTLESGWNEIQLTTPSTWHPEISYGIVVDVGDGTNDLNYGFIANQYSSPISDGNWIATANAYIGGHDGIPTTFGVNDYFIRPGSDIFAPAGTVVDGTESNSVSASDAANIGGLGIGTDFEGTVLDNEWTFGQNNLGNATLDVSEGYATLTNPAGTSFDSISSVGGSENSCGLVHSISGDFDIAVRVASTVQGDGSSMFGFILEGATSAEMVRWSIFGTVDNTQKYGFERSGGVGNNFQGVANLNYLRGHPTWLRARRVGTAYTFFTSMDGVTWNTESSVTSNVDALTIKLKLGQYNLNLGLPFRYSKVVDLGALGTNNARSVAPTYSTGTPQTTDFASLPSWLTLSQAVDGTATISGGQVTLTTAPANGSYGRITYNDPGHPSAGMVVKLTPSGNNLAFAAVGLAVVDGGPNIDQYSASPTYGVEVTLGNALNSPLRVTRPVTTNFWEEAYTIYTGFGAGTTVASPYWCRMERLNERFRIRIWADGDQEPSTWDYDLEDEVLLGEGNLVPFVSASHNDGDAVSGTLVVDDLSFYSLNLITPGVDGTGSSSVSAADAASVTASATVSGTDSSSISISDSANIGVDSNVTGTESSSTSISDTADINAATTISPVESNSLSVSDVSNIVSTTTITAVDVSSISLSDTSNVVQLGTPVGVTDLAGTPGGSSGEVVLTWSVPVGVQVDVIGLMNSYRAAADLWFESVNYVATPWENEGTETDIDLVATDITKSGNLLVGGGGYLESATFSQRLALTAADSATFIIAGTFQFNSANYVVGSRTSSTTTLSNTGANIAMRNDGNIRMYASDAVTLAGGADYSTAAFTNVPAVLTLRFDRGTNLMSLRANGVDLGSVSIAALTGDLEASSQMNIGSTSFRIGAGDLIKGFIYDRTIFSDDKVAYIETYFNEGSA